MFLSCLFCLWGADGDKRDTPPSDYVGKGEPASSRVSSAGGVVVPRQLSGGLSHGPASDEEVEISNDIFFDKDYCQDLEQLERLEALYKSSGVNFVVCAAIANALELLTERDEGCDRVISNLKACSNGVSVRFLEDDGLVSDFIIAYDSAIRARSEVMNSQLKEFENEVLRRAPLTYYDTEIRYAKSLGIDYQRMLSKYQEAEQLLKGWAKRFVAENSN